MVSDLDLVQQKSLFNLPAKVTVNAILMDFKKHAEKTGWKLFSKGVGFKQIKCYFGTVGRPVLSDIIFPY